LNFKNEIDECQSRCLAEFSHVNHYWDRQRQTVVAKILPGELYISLENVPIATTLGSCISACIWDQEIGVGGMNHFMLPQTDEEANKVNWGQRGTETDATRYGNYAMEHLINIILKHGGKRENLVAKVFGGGNVLKGTTDVGMNNIHFVLRYLSLEAIEIASYDFGSFEPRKVLFYPATGKAFVKRIEHLSNDTIYRRDNKYRKEIGHNKEVGTIDLF